MFARLSRIGGFLARFAAKERPKPLEGTPVLPVQAGTPAQEAPRASGYSPSARSYCAPVVKGSPARSGPDGTGRTVDGGDGGAASSAAPPAADLTGAAALTGDVDRFDKEGGAQGAGLAGAAASAGLKDRIDDQGPRAGSSGAKKVQVKDGPNVEAGNDLEMSEDAVNSEGLVGEVRSLVGKGVRLEWV